MIEVGQCVAACYSELCLKRNFAHTHRGFGATQISLSILLQIVFSFITWTYFVQDISKFMICFVRHQITNTQIINLYSAVALQGQIA